MITQKNKEKKKQKEFKIPYTYQFLHTIQKVFICKRIIAFLWTVFYRIFVYFSV